MFVIHTFFHFGVDTSVLFSFFLLSHSLSQIFSLLKFSLACHVACILCHMRHCVADNVVKATDFHFSFSHSPDAKIFFSIRNHQRALICERGGLSKLIYCRKFPPGTSRHSCFMRKWKKINFSQDECL